MAADHMPQIYRPRSNAYPPFRYSNILALIKKKKSRNNTHRKYFQIKRKRGGNLRKNKIKNNEETTSCGSGAESRVRRKIKEHTPIIGNKSLKTQNCTKQQIAAGFGLFFFFLLFCRLGTDMYRQFSCLFRIGTVRERATEIM